MSQIFPKPDSKFPEDRVIYANEGTRLLELPQMAVVKENGDILSYTPEEYQLIRKQTQDGSPRQSFPESKRDELDPRNIERIMEAPSPPTENLLAPPQSNILPVENNFRPNPDEQNLIIYP